MKGGYKMGKLIDNIFSKMSSGQIVYTIGIITGVAITECVVFGKSVVDMWKHLKDES